MEDTGQWENLIQVSCGGSWARCALTFQMPIPRQEDAESRIFPPWRILVDCTGLSIKYNLNNHLGNYEGIMGDRLRDGRSSRYEWGMSLNNDRRGNYAECDTMYRQAIVWWLVKIARLLLRLLLLFIALTMRLRCPSSAINDMIIRLNILLFGCRLWSPCYYYFYCGLKVISWESMTCFDVWDSLCDLHNLKLRDRDLNISADDSNWISDNQVFRPE